MPRVPDRSAPCPCGGAESYAACCRPVVLGSVLAATAEHLMRSRYTAYVVGDVAHLLRSWHPRTRPADLTLDPELTWTGLTIIGHGDDWVEFEAEHRSPAGSGVLRERSRFERRGGRWLYLDGDVS